MAEASDAFGLTVGRDTIGLYSNTSARGFSPAQAGNLRIEGLYFDQVQQGSLVTRIMRNSTVHVGIGAQSYPFPAPTGVVDYQLRVPGDDAGASVLVEHATYGNTSYAEFDFQSPLLGGGVLNFGGGLGYARNTSYNNAAATDEWTVGAIARWSPTPAFTLTPFWSATRHVESGEKPYVFISDTGFPRYRGVDLMSQPWADFGLSSRTFGAVAQVDVAQPWLIRAGVFHSAMNRFLNYEPFLYDTDALGHGTYAISAVPAHGSGSTSGEVRISRQFVSGGMAQTLRFIVRGRTRRDESGGAATEFLGPGTTSAVPLIAPHAFDTGPVRSIHVRQLTGGIAYTAAWRGIAQVTAGLQRSTYRRTLTAPGAPELSTSTSPQLYNLGGALHLSPQLTLYASTTKGFEEIGSAPLNAVNRDELVPAQLTRQVDAGLEYRIRPNLRLVAGVFEIDKPYFDLDAGSIFRRVGTISHRGVELSLAGTLIERWTVVAGATILAARVWHDSGPETTAVGPIPGFASLNVQYRVARLPGLTLESQMQFTSSRYARYDSVALPAVTTVEGGFRYLTKMWGKSATLRLRCLNVTNEYGLTPSASGQVKSFDGRSVDLSLTLDI